MPITVSNRCPRSSSATERVRITAIRRAGPQSIPEGGSSTSSLPPDYEELRERLHGFRGVPAETRARIVSWLLLWRKQVAEAVAKELPAPWIFAPDLVTVEVEWHLPQRKLILTLHPDRKFDYLKVDLAGGVEVETEGSIGFLDEVCRELLWLLED